MLYSFDIFDTLITRITYTPKGIYDTVQVLLCNDVNVPMCLKKNYSEIRIEAEKKLREYHEFIDEEEVTLDEIYHTICEYCGYVYENINYLEKLEVSTEKKCTLPIIDRIARVKELISSGNQVILISDMYLSEHIIRDMLVSVDSVFTDIPIYVSSDYNKTKKIGSLYTYIHDKLGVEYKDWYHTGDNFYSDYLIPKTLGISCELVREWNEFSWINELKKECSINSIETQIVLGIIKYIVDDGDSDLMKLGKSFAGIIVEEYVEWIIDRALQDNVEELYFIARDGYVLKKVADRIICNKNINIVTKYIYGSRKAWRVEEDMLARENVVHYFKENVNFDNKIAFVDANGYGVSISSVANILGEIWKEKIPIYYFSFHRQTENAKCRFYNYCYATGDMIELLCSATHGTTIGYQRQNGKMEPIFDESKFEQNIDDYVEGVLAYTDMMLSIKRTLGIDINVRIIVKHLVATKRYKSGMTLNELWIALNDSADLRISVSDEYYSIDKSKKPNGHRVIIYGAGQVGKRIFRELNNDQDIIISAWTDINYRECTRCGLPIISVNEAIKTEFDYIVIAIKNPMSIKSAKFILTELGIDESKIRYIDA